MNTRSNAEKESLLSTIAPAEAIIKLAIPATLAGRQLGAGGEGQGKSDGDDHRRI